MNIMSKLAFIILIITSFESMANEQLPSYVGTKACIDCHQTEYSDWQGSHHDMSMRHAAPDAVLGNFNNQSITFDGEVSTFFKKGDQYWVNIKGADGKFHDYQIKYTFAYKPLQQYMVEFEDGRVQLIPFAWDSRAKAEGGQRWFHLYPEFTDNRDEFFWTNTGQNWNYMCADCHSTDVKKNFDLASNTYNTTFKEINVGCEACHGPASEHIQWSKNQDNDSSGKGFDRNLAKSVNQWVMREGKTTLFPEKITPTQQTLVCAQCHSRHVQISDNDHVKGNAFGERYMLSLINASQYHADGQIYDEVFVYGSFLQSKMSKNGVVCSNCHNPHTAELIIPKEAVCLQCHQADTYAVKTHHQHQESSTGAQCVNCHMPETTYMQVDKRADHSWHVPRPDLSAKLGTPDTCLNCHEDKDSNWSAQHVQQWFPNSPIREIDHFAPVFSAIDSGYMEAASALSHVAQNKENMQIIRASALERMSPITDTNTLIAVARGARDPDEFIRMAAARGSTSIPLKERWRILEPLLKDDVLAVRLEATNSLAMLWQELSTKQRELLKPAIDEYIKAQEYNNDRGFSHSNRGSIYAYLGEMDKAKKAFLEGIRIEPNFAQTYLNLAELYRRTNKGSAIDLLKQGLSKISDNAPIAYSLGLAYIRNGDSKQALDYFAQAIEKAPNTAQYHYVYGLSLEKSNVNLAQKQLRRAYQISGDPRQLYALCDMQVRYKAFQANQCINEFSQVGPANIVEQLRAQLKQQK